jgi:hypothetical protein
VSRAGNLLFASDGCVRPNVRTFTFQVTLVGKCEHVKIVKVVKVVKVQIEVRAETPSSARHYVETYLRLPQTVVAEVKLGG